MAGCMMGLGGFVQEFSARVSIVVHMKRVGIIHPPS